MKINLITVGKLKESYWKDAIKEYQKRLGAFCQFQIVELAEQRTLQDEANIILKKLKGYIIIFDIHGMACSSENFADIFTSQLNKGISEFSLVIGSSEGLDNEVKKVGHKSVSFGKVTYPHQLMRVIAVEQIYRALTIINNITYHK